ncbi:MAG: hypothetical protein OEZ15_01935, partial [Gammaproteobacteria bacterium]|nr:hypothetical protein [Gammaproteobacteria bacterium]
AITRDDGTVQNRSAANVNVAAHYLDIADTQDNATFQQSDANDGFIQGEILDAAGNVIVNDQIMVITYDDIMEQVHKRVAQEIGNALNSYKTACGGYPEASSFDSTKGNGLFISDPGVLEGHIPVDSPDWGPPNPPANPTPCADGVLPSWVEAEEWHKVTYYEYAASTPCDTANCLSVPPDINIDALIVFAGRDTTGGNRDSALTSDYFEGENDDSNPTSDELIYDDTQAEDYVWVIAP